MIDNFFICFDFFMFILISIFAFLLYIYKSGKDGVNKSAEQEIIESIGRRSDQCLQNYPNGWLPVCDSHDLKKRQVKPIVALGRDLVIYRGTSGKAYVFDAYCPHLGANLGVGGTVVGDDIKCHFHGWQFNNQGDCTAIPGLEDKAIPKATIKKWRCVEVNDFIYVWNSSDEKEPDWSLYKYQQIDRMTYRGSYIKKPVHCHVQDFIENEVDLVHFNTIHSTTNLPNWLQKFIEIEVEVNPESCNKSVNHQAHVHIVPRIRIGFIKFWFKTMTRENGPANLSASLQLQGLFKINLFISLDIITMGTFKQIPVYKVYSDPTIAGYLFAKIAITFYAVLFDQDVCIWNRKCWLRSPAFTKLDDHIIQQRRWYKQFYQEHSKVK